MSTRVVGTLAGRGAGQDFRFRVGSLDGTRPIGANSSYGAVVTPGASNVKGSYASVLSALAKTCYLLNVNFNGGATTTAARDILADVAIDPAGGTAFSQILIPNLLASCAGSVRSGARGIDYWFPIRLPAGASVGARASVNNATAGSLRCNLTAWGSPYDLRRIRYGTAVRAYGITAASSSGTVIVSGEAAEGAWTELGTVAAGDRPWWWQFGFGCNNGTTADLNYHADLAIGAAQSIVQRDAIVHSTAAEQIMFANLHAGCERDAAAGDVIYGRLQCSGTPDTGISMAAYAVV